MSPLRRRLIDELQLHRKAEATIEAYVAAVAELAKLCRRSPDQLEAADVRRYLHHLIGKRPADTGRSWGKPGRLTGPGTRMVAELFGRREWLGEPRSDQRLGVVPTAALR